MLRFNATKRLTNGSLSDDVALNGSAAGVLSLVFLQDIFFFMIKHTEISCWHAASSWVAL